MKCHQCSKPAFYEWPDNGPKLCLDCYHKWSEIQNLEFLKNAVMMNSALDQMDLVTGFHTPGGRMPVSTLAKAIQKAPTLNNISVTNSQIGVLNVGSINKIDAAITLSQGTEFEVAAQQIRNVTEGVITTGELSDLEKREALELLESLSEEMVRGRKKLTIFAILKELALRVGEVASLAKSVADLQEALQTLPL